MTAGSRRAGRMWMWISISLLQGGLGEQVLDTLFTIYYIYIDSTPLQKIYIYQAYLEENCRCLFIVEYIIADPGM
ncbi:hypothetical protein GGI43DRAFT_409806 [Trichoderma evansii]